MTAHHNFKPGDLLTVKGYNAIYVYQYAGSWILNNRILVPYGDIVMYLGDYPTPYMDDYLASILAGDKVWAVDYKYLKKIGD